MFYRMTRTFVSRWNTPKVRISDLTRRERNSYRGLSLGYRLSLTVEDWDEISAADYMGHFVLDLQQLAADPTHAPQRAWHTLQKSEAKKGDVAGAVELIAQWREWPVYRTPLNHVERVFSLDRSRAARRDA